MQGNSYGGDDKVVTCVDCGAQFTFTAKDQAFYQERGYQAPRRCKTCRDKRKTGGGGSPAMGGGAYGGSQGSYGGGGGSGGGGHERGNRGGDRGNRSGGGGDDRGNRIDDRGHRAPQGGNYAAGGGGHGQGQGQGGAPTGPQFKVQCSGCGVETTVPFKPDPNRPVYCRTCYLSRRKA